MRLIITRHGETESNKAGIIQGHLHGKLSALGQEQAVKLARRLKEEKIDFIFSSDLARAADTAKEIAKFHHAPVKFVKELRERHMGDFTGKKHNEINLKKGESTAVFSEIKNGESLKELYERARVFLHKILEHHSEETVLFVGHNGINKALMAVIGGKTSQDIKEMINLDNTSVTILEIDENKNHKIHLLNDVSHLN
jgi:broad specificity phosphatase PhoE